MSGEPEFGVPEKQSFSRAQIIDAYRRLVIKPERSDQARRHIQVPSLSDDMAAALVRQYHDRGDQDALDWILISKLATIYQIATKRCPSDLVHCAAFEA